MESGNAQGKATGIRENLGWLRRFIEGNYLYFISAALMLLAAYLMMNKSPENGDGRKFSAMLQGLSMLQGYELLVIATALLALRKFRDLDDAFSLLIIEIVLLFDPTFFSTMFYMLDRPGLLVNLACLAVVFVKSPVLVGGLRFRFNRRYWAAFFFMALVVYLFSMRLWKTFILGPIHADVFHHLVMWLLLVYALIVPRARNIVFAQDGEARFHKSREKVLPVFLLLLPPFFLVSHGFANIWVHGLYPGAPLVAPLFMGLLVLGLTQRPDSEPETKLALINICSIIVLFISLLSLDKRIITYDPVDNTYAQFQILPLAGIMTLATALGLFIWVYRLHDSRSALLHIFAIPFAALAWLFITIKSLRTLALGALKSLGYWIAYGVEDLGEVLGGVFKFFGGIISNGLHFAGDHPVPLLCVLLVVFWLAAWRWRKYVLFLFAAISTAVVAALALPGSLLSDWAELIQMAGIAWLIVEHGKEKRLGKSDRAVLVFMVLAAATYRFGASLTVISGAILACELAACIVAGILLGEQAYLVLALLWLGGGLVALGVWLREKISGTVVLIVSALSVFGVAVSVTVFKERLVEWLTPVPPPLPVEEQKQETPEDPDTAENSEMEDKNQETQAEASDEEE